MAFLPFWLLLFSSTSYIIRSKNYHTALHPERLVVQVPSDTGIGTPFSASIYC